MYNNKRLALSIFWVLLGIVLIGLSVMEVLDNSIYAGMGGALIGVGILQIVRIVRYKICGRGSRGDRICYCDGNGAASGADDIVVFSLPDVGGILDSVSYLQQKVLAETLLWILNCV